jgi:hypothetical protein
MLPKTAVEKKIGFLEVKNAIIASSTNKRSACWLPAIGLSRAVI